MLIEDFSRLPQELQVELGVLTVPSEAAQSCAELLDRSGIKAILNFTGRPLISPVGTVVRNVNLTHELAILAYDLAGEPDLTL